MTRRRSADDLRSQRWFAPQDLRSFGHRSRMMQMGYATADFMGKPVIAIINTWSDLQQCHQHFKARVEEVKRGVWQAGGFPVELGGVRPCSVDPGDDDCVHGRVVAFVPGDRMLEQLRGAHCTRAHQRS